MVPRPDLRRNPGLGYTKLPLRLKIFPLACASLKFPNPLLFYKLSYRLSDPGVPITRFKDLEFGYSGKANFFYALTVFGSVLVKLLGTDSPSIILGEAIVRILDELESVGFVSLMCNR